MTTTRFSKPACIKRSPMDTEYGTRLAKLRIKAGLSQSTLARAMEVQPSTVSHIEAGRVLPRSNKLRRLAAILDARIDEVVP